MVVLDELHPFRHLLPELDVPVKAGRDQEVRTAGGHEGVAYHVPVHVAALVHRRRGQGSEVHLLGRHIVRERSR